MSVEKRIEILDSFRFIAILSVILYHFYTRWTPPLNSISLYPYGSNYNYFSFGYLGVEFFFVISGFVIAFTLTRTHSFSDFWKKRLIRLFPSMIVCSVVTLVIIRMLDTENLIPKGHSYTNFLYSISFISPGLLNQFFSYFNITGAYINGSYWSLWPEIQFYLVSSCLYFINKKYFVRNIAYLTIFFFWAHLLVLMLMTNVQATNTFHLNISTGIIDNYRGITRNVFNLYYSLYFLMGVLFFQLYTRENKTFSIISLFISVSSLMLYERNVYPNQYQTLLVIGIMFLLFIAFIRFSKQLKYFSINLFTNIGVASYSLYLIHESIGVLLIHKYASIFGGYDFLFPVLIIVVMIVFSLLSFKYIEKPVGSFLKKRLIR